MRIGLVLGAAALVLAGGLQGAEARGRGFGRIAAARISAPAAATARPEPRLAVRPALQPTLVPVRTVAAAGAAGTALGVADLRLGDRPDGAPPAADVAPRPVQEARAQAPTCAPGRRIGGLSSDEAGFCLIN